MIILKNFTYNFELTLDNLAESNSHLIVVLGDFNTKSKNWHINDKEFVTSQYGLRYRIPRLVLILCLHSNQT